MKSARERALEILDGLGTVRTGNAVAAAQVYALLAIDERLAEINAQGKRIESILESIAVRLRGKL